MTKQANILHSHTDISIHIYTPDVCSLRHFGVNKCAVIHNMVNSCSYYKVLRVFLLGEILVFVRFVFTLEHQHLDNRIDGIKV